MSNCSEQTAGTSTTSPACISGYPKPAWQNAPGVPNDQARDLPDVSLFASNGANLSAVPICTLPGDCAPVTSGNPQIYLVGGTSASSPSMAGIMALIDQKYGRQGQANYTLYALARQYPSDFHDITVGTNDIECQPGLTALCATPVPGEQGAYSFGVYAAGPKYDLASGLGSVDVNQLLTDWNKVVYAASITSLQATPASIVHGSPVSVSVAVKANSGSNTPSGSVVLASAQGTTIPANLPLALTNGSATASLTNLPGGSYQLTAKYGGDGNFAASTSTPVSMTVTPEASVTSVLGQYIYTSFASSATETLASTIANNGQVPFGSEWSFTATPTGNEQNALALGTGTATFTDGSTTAAIPLNANGTATWTPPNLAIGAHSLTVTYPGDASYQASTSTPLAFTVVKGSAAFSAIPEVSESYGLNGPGYSYPAGTTLVVHVLLEGYNAPVPPTGTVTVNLGSLTQTLNLSTEYYLNKGVSTAFVTFNNVQAGTYTLSASYSGDTNWSSENYTYDNTLNFVAASTLATTTTLTVTPSSTDNSGEVTFKVTVQTQSSQQSSSIIGEVFFYANGTLFTGYFLFGTTANTATATFAYPASSLPSGALQVVAEFEGAQGLAPSISAPVPLTVGVSEFLINPAAENITVGSGKTVSVPIQLGGPAGASVSVQLSCTPSSASIGCAISPNSVSVTGSGSATLTINAFTTTTTGANEMRFPAGQSAGLALAALVLLVLPRRKRAGALWVLLVLCAGLSVAIGCRGSSSTKTGTGSRVC